MKRMVGRFSRVRRGVALVGLPLLAGTLAATTGLVEADHLPPQEVESNAAEVATSGSVGTETACPDGWSSGSAQYLVNVTGHLAWTFTVPADHTGVVNVIGYRDPVVARPFYFWVDSDPMALQANDPGAQDCRAVLVSSAELPAGTHTVNVSGVNDFYAYIDTFELVTAAITGDLVVTKVSDTPGVFDFTVDCPGTDVVDQAVRVEVAAAGPPGTASAPVAGIPVNSTCTVTETTAPGFAPQPPQDVTIAEGTNGVTFTNVRETGSLVVSKTTDVGTGTFSFTVDCEPGTAYDSTFELAGGQTRRIDGIPTLTTCTVTEAASPLYTSAVTPPGGAVTIATGDNPVSFVNSVRPPVLGITKTADAASVTAGAAVGFTVTVANTGAGPATGVTLSDPLPSGAGASWAVSPAYAGPGTCSVTGAAPAQTLACAIGDLAPGATASVHVSSATSAAATLTNTATAQAANAGPVSATAAVTVLAPATTTTTPTTTPTTVPTTAPATAPTTAPATVTTAAAPTTVTTTAAAVSGAGSISTVSTGAATGVTSGRAAASTDVAAAGLARTGLDAVRLALAGAAMVAAGLLVLVGAGRPVALRARRRRP